MPGSSNASFIPKRTPSNKSERSNSPRQLFLGSLLVRVLFFAVLIAAAAVFFYERHLNGQLNEATQNFKTATDSYEADGEKLQTIITTDKRLAQANNLLKESVSVSTLLNALQQATAESIQFTSLDYSQTGEGSLLLEATIDTDTFDSTMFQRSVYGGNELFRNTLLKDVKVSTEVSKIDDTYKTKDIEYTKDAKINFKAIINVDPKDVPAVAIKEASFIPITSVTEGDSSSSESTVENGGGKTPADVSVGFDNQGNI